MPLVTKTDGTKFGKTESGTIWLDAKKTSPYAFYQFWLNTADADVYQFLRFFTFLSPAEIADIETQDKAGTGKPQAQRILAEQVTAIVHGQSAVDAAVRISQSLFNDSIGDLTESDLEQLAQDGMPGVQLDRSVVSLVDALPAAALAKSKTEARTFVQSGAVSINGVKQAEVTHQFADAERLFGRFTLLKRGKKQFALISWAE